MAIEEVSREIVYEPGGIELDQVFIINYDNKVVDIKESMSEFSIFYNMFTNHARCEIAITESLGLSELLPIVGDETIYIRFKTPTRGKLFTKFQECVFQVYSIENKSHDKIRSDTYIISGISEQYIMNKITTIHKTYSGQKETLILQDVYAKLKGTFPLGNNKSLVLGSDALDKKRTFFFASKSPFECIEQLTNEINYRLDKPANYLFFENEDSYQFKRFDSFLSEPTKEKFYFGESSVSEDSSDTVVEGAEQKGTLAKSEDYQQINDLQIDKQFNTLESATHGLYMNTVTAVDTIVKEDYSKTFIYDKDKDLVSHVDKKGHIYTEKSIFKNPKSNLSFSMVSHVRKNVKKPYYEQNNYLKENFSKLQQQDTHLIYPREKHEYYHLNVASKSQSRFVKVFITIPGNTDIKLGDMIDIIFTQSSNIEDFSAFGDENWLLETKFLIIKVRHTYNKVERSFFTVLECIKDSFAKEPEQWAQDFDTKVKQAKNKANR